MIRVAMLSYWHVHAGDYAKQASEHPETQIVAVWDELPERGQKEADLLGVKFYADVHDLLAQTDIDAVIVDAPTNLHRDVLAAAAKAGKHIFTEKVVAPTLEEANEIIRAVEESGIKLTVSLPRLYEGYTTAIQEIAEQGLLGQLTLVRTRLSHNGATRGWLPEHFFSKEQCGGGAMIDLGCHPMYLARLFLGMPQSVSSTYGYVTGKEVEDNAVAVLRYESGAIGIVEAGFVNEHSPFAIELHGTEGSALFSSKENTVKLRSARLEDQARGWIARGIAGNKPSAFEQWVNHIVNGTVASENIALAVDLTKLMEASNRSAAEGGRPVAIADLRG
ncbi:Gfo/Idh/MocA family protein [Paenibacillus chartarius]|uniref:Gfo/Idh/MocA family protein n=1 Tax=Paenibacillus chartarius TaxID=747481 RepID=A0ABV6DFG1_9BACL